MSKPMKEDTPLLNPGETTTEALRFRQLAAAGRDAKQNVSPTPSSERDDDSKPFRFITAAELQYKSSRFEARVAFGMVAVYFIAVVLVFSYLLDRKKIIDSIYFGVITIFTIGASDFVASTTTQRMFVCSMAILAVMLIATALGVLLTFLLDEEERQQEESDAAEEIGLQAQKKEEESLFCEKLKEAAKAAAVVLGSTYAFALLEGTSVVTAFYWCINTVTTVGFNDVTPQTTGGKLFAILFILFGTYIVGQVLNSFVQIPLDIRRRRLEARVHHQFGKSLSTAEHDALLKKVKDLGLSLKGGRGVSKAAFTLLMLYSMNKITKEDVQDCYDAFNHLDKNSDEVLDWGDIIQKV